MPITNSPFSTSRLELKNGFCTLQLESRAYVFVSDRWCKESGQTHFRQLQYDGLIVRHVVFLYPLKKDIAREVLTLLPPFCILYAPNFSEPLYLTSSEGPGISNQPKLCVAENRESDAVSTAGFYLKRIASFRNRLYMVLFSETEMILLPSLSLIRIYAEETPSWLRFLRPSSRIKQFNKWLAEAKFTEVRTLGSSRPMA